MYLILLNLSSLNSIHICFLCAFLQIFFQHSALSQCIFQAFIFFSLCLKYWCFFGFFFFFLLYYVISYWVMLFILAVSMTTQLVSHLPSGSNPAHPHSYWCHISTLTHSTKVSYHVVHSAYQANNMGGGIKHAFPSLYFKQCACMNAPSLQLCSTLRYLIDCSPSGFSVHEILQTRILE